MKFVTGDEDRVPGDAIPGEIPSPDNEVSDGMPPAGRSQHRTTVEGGKT